MIWGDSSSSAKAMNIPPRTIKINICCPSIDSVVSDEP
jgi:hypothetical protein